MKFVHSLLIGASALSAIPAQALPLMDNGIKYDFLNSNTKTQVTHFDDENPNVKWIVLDRISLAEDNNGPEFGFAYNNSNRPGLLTLRVRAGLSDEMRNHALDLQSQGFEVRVIQPTSGLWTLLFTDEKGVDHPLVAAGALQANNDEIVFGKSVTPQIPAVLRIDISPPGVATMVDGLRSGMAVQLRYKYMFRATMDSLKANVEVDWEKVSSTLQQTNLKTKAECISGGLTGSVSVVSLNLGASGCAYDSKFINNLTRTMVERGDIKISIVDSDSALAKDYRSIIMAQIGKIIQDAAFAPIEMKLLQNLNSPTPSTSESCLTSQVNGAKTAVDVFGKPATPATGTPATGGGGGPVPPTGGGPVPPTGGGPVPPTGGGPVPPTGGGPVPPTGGGPVPPTGGGPVPPTGGGPVPPTGGGPVPPGTASAPVVPSPGPRPVGVRPTAAAATPTPSAAAPAMGIAIDFKYCQQKSEFYVYDKRESFESRKITYTFDLKSIQEFQGEVTGSLNNLCEQDVFTKKFVNVDERSTSPYSFGCPVRAFITSGKWTFWNKLVEDYAYSQGTLNATTVLPVFVPSATKGISVYGGWGSTSNPWGVQ
jgi:hypothetical protein